MQSLKSTAFAVTLLAISFGLYCVSSTDNRPMPESDLIEPITIENDFAVAEESGGPALASSVNSATNSFSDAAALPEANSGDSSSPNIKLPELPKLTAPNLTTPDSQFASSSQATDSSPLKLPNFSSPEPKAPILSDLPSKTETLELPEFSTRQPMTSNPTARDEGLIDALKTSEFKPATNHASQTPGGFSNGDSADSLDLEPATSGTSSPDSSFNSLASATATTGGFSGVKTAGGASKNPEFKKSSKSTSSVSGLWDRVDQLIADDNYLNALEELSQHYVSNEIVGPQRQRLVAYLDALAGKVIYSSEHHLAGRPYTVKLGDTLGSLSRELSVPTEVIYNINRDKFVGTEVTPGMELKIVQGPFHAEVDLAAKQITLFVGDLYAGRFPIIVGVSGNPDSGSYNVLAKNPKGYTWRDENGNDYPPESPNNAYGPYWIGLSKHLCIHAVAEGTPEGHRGCIGLSENDAKDIFGILSKNSQIRIVK